MSRLHGNTGSGNGNWKGGVTITNRGYRKVIVKEHPRCDRDGYVLEHILVMEKNLGRYLDVQEEVHHIDGDKLNNDISNLTLYPNHKTHLLEGHNSFRRGKEVACDTCGGLFWKKPSKISKYNFCQQSHVNPLLWRGVQNV